MAENFRKKVITFLMVLIRIKKRFVKTTIIPIFTSTIGPISNAWDIITALFNWLRMF